jgi:type IV pilus assembly protein PilQ
VQGMPAISTRQIVTNVQVKNGQTIVLGGIYELDHEESKESLPFLGNIPVIGLLFSQNRKRDHKRELLIFVTPKIMPQAI